MLHLKGKPHWFSGQRYLLVQTDRHPVTLVIQRYKHTDRQLTGILLLLQKEKKLTVSIVVITMMTIRMVVAFMSIGMVSYIMDIIYMDTMTGLPIQVTTLVPVYWSVFSSSRMEWDWMKGMVLLLQPAGRPILLDKAKIQCNIQKIIYRLINRKIHTHPILQQLVVCMCVIDKISETVNNSLILTERQYVFIIIPVFTQFDDIYTQIFGQISKCFY